MTWDTLVHGLGAEDRRDLAAALSAVDDSEPELLKDWIRFWFAHIHSKKIAPKTIASYRTSVEQHIIPVIGHVRIDRLTPQHVRDVELEIRAKGLGGSTAQSAHRVLSLALRDAVRDGLISRNVAALVDQPKKKPPTMTVLNAADGIRLLETVQHDRLGSRIAAALLTGARQGELLGLELDRVTDELDLSWQLKRFSWSHGCNPSKPWEPACRARRGGSCPKRRLDAPEDQEFRHLTGGLWLSRPKSAAGWRVIPLVEPLRSIIERRMQAAAQEPNPHGLLWTAERNGWTGELEGSPIDPRNDNRAWHEALARADVPDAMLHSARHTAVDLLYSAGVDEVTIAEIVGHSTHLMSRKYRTRGNRDTLRDALSRAYKPLIAEPKTTPGGTS